MVAEDIPDCRTAYPSANRSSPNELWSTEYKGEFSLGNREHSDPLTLPIMLAVICSAARHSPPRVKTAFAVFGQVWLLTPCAIKSYCLRMNKSEYLTEYDRIVKTVQMYVDGSKQGKSELMRPAFHPEASFFGYAGEQLAVGTRFLFDWIDKNGPAPDIEPRVVSVDILDSIAVVRLEVAGWSGRLAGSDVRMSDLFTLLKTPSGWKIIQKAFHWHAAERTAAA